MLSDQPLHCRDCNQPFTFTVGEQMFYVSKNIINPPSRCATCRAGDKGRVDQFYPCVDCGQTFVFSKGEQKFYKERSMTPPTRCQACRERKKAQPRDTTGTNTGQPRQLYSAICYDCGNQTQVPFQPKPGRAIYCRNC